MCSESSYSGSHHATVKCEPVICDTYCPAVSAILLSVIPTTFNSNIHHLRSVSYLIVISSLFLSKQGYKYTKIPGQCCGTCKAAACIMTVGDNITRVLQVTIPVLIHFWWTLLVFPLFPLLAYVTFIHCIFSHVRQMLIQAGNTLSRTAGTVPQAMKLQL